MQPTAHGNYLVTEVMTATTPKLHLIVIEAAIRMCNRAMQRREAGKEQEAFSDILKAEELVGQLIAGLNEDAAPDLVRQMRAIYAFVFRCLVDAQRKRDDKKLADAVRILEIERETWRQVCARINAERPAPPHHFTATPEILAGAMMPTDMSSFSLDA